MCVCCLLLYLLNLYKVMDKYLTANFEGERIVGIVAYSLFHAYVNEKKNF